LKLKREGQGAFILKNMSESPPQGGKRKGRGGNAYTDKTQSMSHHEAKSGGEISKCLLTDPSSSNLACMMGKNKNGRKILLKQERRKSTTYSAN